MDKSPAEPIGVIERDNLHCIVTDDAARFEKHAPRFLGAKIQTPELVRLDELSAPMHERVLKVAG